MRKGPLLSRAKDSINGKRLCGCRRDAALSRPGRGRTPEKRHNGGPGSKGPLIDHPFCLPFEPLECLLLDEFHCDGYAEFGREPPFDQAD